MNTGADATSATRVCIMVGNNCTVDVRILRQAASFTARGYDVTVLAVLEGEVPAQERKDGFEIRRVPGHFTWKDGFPRMASIVTRLGRVRRRRPSIRDGDAPGRDSVVDAEPVPSARLGTSGWIRWLRTGRDPAPRSFLGAGPASVRHRLAVVAQVPRLPLRRAKRRAARARRVAGARVRRLTKRPRRFGRRWILLPTRYRQIDRRMAAEAIALDAALYWANDVRMLRPARAAADATGARVVYDAHDLYWDAPTIPFAARRLWGQVERTHIRRMDHVFTVCEPIARETQHRYGIPRPTVVMNCPSEGWSSTAHDGRSPLHTYRRPGERIVLFHGSLSPWRGIEQLIDSLALLPPDLRLVILGHGGFRRRLEEHARRSAVPDRITFLESVSPTELPAWIAGADVGTIPYLRRGRNHEYSTPNKLFECMHAGLPVVVNALPEIEKIVTGVGFGVVCDSSDPASIAQAIIRLTGDRAGYEAMRRRALAAAPSFTWEQQAEKIFAAISQLGLGPDAGGEPEPKTSSSARRS